MGYRVVAMSWEGQVFPWFIKHVPDKKGVRNEQRVIVDGAISGMNIKLMHDWVVEFTNYIGAGPGVLILDRLAVHINRAVNLRLQAHMIKVFLLPPQAGKYLSPCDHFFFAHLKGAMLFKDCSTTEAKQAAFFELCSNWDATNVIRNWDSCGWVYSERTQVN
jgi:hypothetical protein